jgi:asparagine synthase (glutamine-hydrolysing)
VLAGAWGARAGELLARASERRGARVHRVGGLAMLSPPHAAEGSWCCWLFGEPEDSGTLAACFGRGHRGDLPAAFGRALAELGEAACELLCGRFVVVALDRDRGRCLLARDQLGAQPLVYARVADGVLFSEHECDLLDLLPRTPGPDRLALLQWIENGLTLPGRTLYEGLQRLPAGHRLILGGPGGHVSVERWWNIRYEGFEEGSATALAEGLREAAFAAIGRAAAGARAPAVKLSGGLDSACVAAGLAADGLPDGSALALGGAFATHPVADESELIEETARHTRLPLELVAFDPAGSMLAPALAHIARWRLPPATPNLFLWQPVTARARELGVDRVLDGEGGDELFGLAAYLIADMLRAGRLPTAWSLTGRIPGMGLDPGRQVRLRVLRRYGLSPLVPASVQRRRETRAARTVSASAIVARADAQALAELRMATARDQRDGPFWWRSQVESLIDMHDLLDMGAHFRREAVDENIDVRHPFLYDLQLIETALRLPPRAQFDPVRDRPLLRDALTGLIPEAVRTRHEKSHFTPLVLAGMRAEEAGLIEPLRRADAPVRAYVVPEALDRKIEGSPDARPMLGAGPLWLVAIANRWLVSQAGDSA